MKSLLLTALAATLVVPSLATPALAQNHPGNHGNNHGRQVSQVAKYKQFKRGQKFDRRYAQDYREINYRQYRGLKAPPRGYHWVRSGNDALLVALRTGVIASIVAGTFR